MSNPRPDTWSERKKWTMGIVSALIVPALVGVGTVLFRPASEPIVIPKPYHEGSLCTGPWVFKTRDVCDDPDKPIFETIVDGEKCGWIERERTIQPEGYKRCRDPTHGVERYQYNDPVSKSSGWVGGGRDPLWWCQSMRNEYQATKPGTSLVWSDPAYSEQSNKDILGKVTYKYHCSAVARWRPVHRLGESLACGEKDPVVEHYRVPQSCIDRSRIAGYEQTQNRSCALQSAWSIEPNSQRRAIVARYEAGVLDGPPRCTTCDEFAANAEQQGRCLIERASVFAAGGVLDQDPDVKARMNATAAHLIGADRPMDRATRRALERGW